MELHREAVRWPIGRFEYVGIDAEGEGDAARQGEVSIVYTLIKLISLELMCGDLSCKMDIHPIPKTYTAAIRRSSQNVSVGILTCVFTRTIPHLPS